jgi:hypothetical protein
MTKSSTALRAGILRAVSGVTPLNQGTLHGIFYHNTPHRAAKNTLAVRPAAPGSPTQAAAVLVEEMPCLRCGSCGPHVAGPGTGPHHARLVCGGCGAFLRWLPKPGEAWYESLA